MESSSRIAYVGESFVPPEAAYKGVTLFAHIQDSGVPEGPEDAFDSLTLLMQAAVWESCFAADADCALSTWSN